MRNPPIHWAEGLFLRPHHFQAMERSWREQLQASFEFAIPAFYGVGSVDFTVGSDNILELSRLDVRWRDGSTFRFDVNHVERIDLNARIPKESRGNPVLLSIGLPLFRHGFPGVGSTQQERYVESFSEVEDESSGSNPQPIAFLLPNVQFVFDFEDHSGMELIPIARIVADSNSGFRLDTDYVPPCLSITASEKLMADVSELSDLIRRKAESISGSLLGKRRASFAIQADPEKGLLLSMLNEAWCELGSFVHAPLVHPWNLYQSLCRLAGKFSLLSPSLLPTAVPPYLHDSLDSVFPRLFEDIRGQIQAVQEEPYQQRYLVGRGEGLAVELEEEWMSGEWDWYFGVEPINVGRDECIQLLKKHINWKLGSADEVDEYMKTRKSGVSLRPMLQLPPALPADRKWVYFQIVCENEAWDSVRKTRNLTMRIGRELISNLDSLEGANRLTLTIQEEPFAFEFSIFVVRRNA